MRLEWRQALCGFLLGCIVGALAGASLQRATAHRFWRRGPDPERITNRLAQKLELDAEQRQTVKMIVDARHAKVMELRGETDVKLRDARRVMYEEIRKILRPEQQGKLDGMIAHSEARFQRRKEKK